MAHYVKIVDYKIELFSSGSSECWSYPWRQSVRFNFGNIVRVKENYSASKWWTLKLTIEFGVVIKDRVDDASDNNMQRSHLNVYNNSSCWN